MSERAQHMIDGQLAPGSVIDTNITNAMAAVPREQFVPDAYGGIAYIDEDIPLGNGRYLMEPLLFARMIQAANLSADAHVLDIGSALGYSAAILSHLCKKVVALEEQRELAEKARQNLHAQHISNVDIVTASLAAGCREKGPYDAIFIGGAVETVPDILFSQLKDGGELVVIKQIKNAPTALSGLGKLILCRRQLESIQSREICDAATPLLPGFNADKPFTL